MKGSISCVICAFNEAERIGALLDVIEHHPSLGEIIVVDDGSTDATAEIAARFERVRLISYPVNRGKTYALAQGVAAASHPWLMFLDADLTGVSAADIDALAAPVLRGDADVSISLRGNSLGLYRSLGLDFVSGERVIPAGLLRDAMAEMEALPRWGGEAFINERIIANRLRVAVVDWASVSHTRKTDKVGFFRGSFNDLEMMRDAVTVMSPFGVIRQTIALLHLARRRPAVAPASRGLSESAA